MISKPGQIVVGVDLDDSSESGKSRPLALANFAQALEDWIKSPVHLIFASGTNEHKGHSKDQLEYIEKLQQLAQNKNWTFSLRSGSPVTELLSVDKDSADPVELYVLGIKGLGVVKRLYLGSVTEELVKKSEKPLALLSSHGISPWENKSKFSKDRHLLVATDLSDRSKIVEEFALSFAKRVGASVTLLHNTWRTYKLMEDVAIQSGAIPLIFEETIQTIEKQSHEALSEKRKIFKDQGIKCQMILDIEPRSVAESILAIQENGYSMLIMGSRTRNRVLTAVWGSTLRDTLVKSALPTIAVKC
ncbi:MAG: universal stress protein [Pseudobdellovibrionaceae bacterium]